MLPTREPNLAYAPGSGPRELPGIVPVSHKSPWKSNRMQLGDLGPKPIASQDPYIQSQTSFCSPIRQQYKPPAVWKAGAQKKLFTEHMGSTRSLRMASESSENTIFRIKHVRYKGNDVPILMQNLNGPCPLLAISKAAPRRAHAPRGAAWPSRAAPHPAQRSAGVRRRAWDH